MSKYDNSVTFLSPFFTILTTSKEFYDTNKIQFRCNICEYTHTLTVSSFSNKRYKISLEEFCTNCKKHKELSQQQDNFIKTIKELCGHVVLSVNFSSRKVIYECFTCKKENNTFICNLKRSKLGVCPSCQNDKNKVEFEKIKMTVEKQGMKLLSLKEDYKNNKTKLKLLCKCGENYDALYCDIKRAKNCVQCKTQKFKDTCIERYGEDNVSKVPEIFEKITMTSFSKKEFVFPKTRRIVHIMGYEPQAILWLLNQVCDPLLSRPIEEDDIITGKTIKTFTYIDEKQIKHVYFPDLLIKNTILIIEVKSLYIFNKDHLKNKLKFNSVINNGYILRLVLFDEKKKVHDFICKTLKDVDDLFKFSEFL